MAAGGGGKDPAILAFELQRNVLGDIFPDLQPKQVHFGTDKEVKKQSAAPRSNGASAAGVVNEKKLNRRSQHA